MNIINDKTSDLNYYIINKRLKENPSFLLKIQYKYVKIFSLFQYFQKILNDDSKVL